MGLADKLQQEQHSTKMYEGLTSRLHAAEQQVTLLTNALNTTNSFVQSSSQEIIEQIDEMERRISTAITQHFASASEPSLTNEKLSSIMHALTQIVHTQKQLVDTVDGKKFSAVVSSLTATANRLDTTTAHNVKLAELHTRKVDEIGTHARSAIRETIEVARHAVRDAANGAAGLVTAQISEAAARAQRVTDAAERLEKRLGWATAGRMALALLPIATVLLMFVMSMWTIVHGVMWVLAMDVDLWLRILSGVALSGMIVGACFGIWRAVIWLRDKLKWAK